MKIPGLLGGIGPESTIDYYRQLIAAYRSRTGNGSYPPILINSLNLQEMIGLVAAGKLTDLAAFLAGEFERLARAGASFGALAANTPHIVFEDVRRASPIPLISIVEATRDEARRLGLRRIGLFGTRFTMQGRFYPDVFAPAGITILRPPPGDEDFIHEKYMGELVPGVFLPETRERVLSIARDLVTRDGVDAVVLGGTELPILLKGASEPGVRFLDTTAIHVERIAEEMLS